MCSGRSPKSRRFYRASQALLWALAQALLRGTGGNMLSFEIEGKSVALEQALHGLSDPDGERRRGAAEKSGPHGSWGAHQGLFRFDYRHRRRR